MERHILRLVSLSLFITCLAVFISVTTKPVHAREYLFIDAAKWARANDGIAIYISLGEDSGLEADALEANFESGFRKHFGVEANAFVEAHDGKGSSVMYFIGETVTEPEAYHTATTSERMKEIVAQYQAYREISGD